MLEFTRLADRHGAILLAAKAKGPTWDLDSASKKKVDADSPHIRALLQTLFARVAVDRARVAVLGFSDGASYALSLGLSNPQMFRSIVALSPGFLIPPQRLDVTQRIFIAHGYLDEILPFGNVHDRIVPALRSAGYNVKVRWFASGHEIKPSAVQEALDFALGAAAEDGTSSVPSKPRQ